MAEITYNDLLGQLSGMEKDQFEGVFGSSGFLDNYQNNPNSLSVTGHDNFNKFEPIAKAYQASETIPKGNFVSNMFNFSSADAAMPDKTYGLQDSMMGMSINPDGSLNYNNTQPQNLGFRSMVDMANDANNFDSQFSYPASQPQNLGFIESAPQPKEAIYQDRIRNNNLSNFSYEPKEEGILRGLQDKIGAGFNNLIDNPLTRGAGTAFNFLRGSVPGMLMSGLGALFNRDPNAPSYQTRSPDIDYSNLNTTNLNDFYDSNPDSDTFGTTRFDRATTAFGKSRALFGPNGIAATKAKMAKAKAAKAKAYKEKQAADAITAANNPYNPDGSRAAYNYAGRDNAQGTHTSTMSNAQAQANQDRGRGRYNQGGLASMFTRRR